MSKFFERLLCGGTIRKRFETSEEKGYPETVCFKKENVSKSKQEVAS